MDGTPRSRYSRRASRGRGPRLTSLRAIRTRKAVCGLLLSLAVAAPGFADTQHFRTDVKTSRGEYSLHVYEPIRDRHRPLLLPISGEGPLVVSWPRQTEQILIFLSGDGGWMELDREVAARLHRASVAVVGWNTLRYFWEARSPEELDADLSRVIESLPDSLPVFAGGFSFGAEVVPVSLDRQGGKSSPAARLGGWVLLAPAVAREQHLPILCLEPASGEKSGCPSKPQANLRHIRLAGSHHFGGDYSTLAEKILGFMREVEIQKR